MWRVVSEGAKARMSTEEAAVFSLFSSSRPQHREPGRAIVRCEDDYERATQRVAELGNPSTGSSEERELLDLLEAIDKWDVRHDDATGWG